jgi:hypothetical protein
MECPICIPGRRYPWLITASKAVLSNEGTFLLCEYTAIVGGRWHMRRGCDEKQDRVDRKYFILLTTSLSSLRRE